MQKGDGPVSSRAAEAIINRGFGKPAQAVEHKGVVKHDLSQLSDDELYAIIRGDGVVTKAKKRIN